MAFNLINVNEQQIFKDKKKIKIIRDQGGSLGRGPQITFIAFLVVGHHFDDFILELKVYLV